MKRWRTPCLFNVDKKPKNAIITSINQINKDRDQVKESQKSKGKRQKYKVKVKSFEF